MSKLLYDILTVIETIFKARITRAPIQWKRKQRKEAVTQGYESFAYEQYDSVYKMVEDFDAEMLF